MRKEHLISVFLCCVAVSACEVEFDLKGLEGDPLFLMDGYVRTDPFYPGTGNLSMYIYAVPSAAGEREFSEEARCTLRVYRNSELVIENDDITVQSFYGLIPGDFIAGPGDEIVVTAGSEGFPTASARTVIPGEAPVPEVSCSMSGKNLNVRFSFVDDAGTEDAYAVCFRTIQNDDVPDDSQIGYSLDLAFGNSPESSFLDVGPFDVSWMDGVRYYGISDDTFNGQRKEFEVTVPSFSANGENAWFRVELQRISRERLRYEIACNDKGNNVLGFIGLSPVTFAYTNVSGGSGCFSGASTSYSDWIRIQ